MTIEQTLQNEIEESKRWLDRETNESTYKLDLQKRIELINWVLEKMKNPDIPICDLIESKMNVTIHEINQIDDAVETYPLHSELRKQPSSDKLPLFLPVIVRVPLTVYSSPP
jgi:hypothetical protein